MSARAASVGRSIIERVTERPRSDKSQPESARIAPELRGQADHRTLVVLRDLREEPAIHQLVDELGGIAFARRRDGLRIQPPEELHVVLRANRRALVVAKARAHPMRTARSLLPRPPVRPASIWRDALQPRVVVVDHPATATGL